MGPSSAAAGRAAIPRIWDARIPRRHGAAGLFMSPICAVGLTVAGSVL